MCRDRKDHAGDCDFLASTSSRNCSGSTSRPERPRRGLRLLADHDLLGHDIGDGPVATGKTTQGIATLVFWRATHRLSAWSRPERPRRGLRLVAKKAKTPTTRNVGSRDRKDHAGDCDLRMIRVIRVIRALPSRPERPRRGLRHSSRDACSPHSRCTDRSRPERPRRGLRLYPSDPASPVAFLVVATGKTTQGIATRPSRCRTRPRSTLVATGKTTQGIATSRAEAIR